MWQKGRLRVGVSSAQPSVAEPCMCNPTQIITIGSIPALVVMLISQKKLSALLLMPEKFIDIGKVGLR